jgi:hypothetical protein
VHFVEKANQDAFTQINQLVEDVESQVSVMVMTASDQESFEAFRHEVQLPVPYYFADATVLKTMIRSNPGLIFLSDGLVKGKWHFHDIPSAEEVIQMTY